MKKIEDMTVKELRKEKKTLMRDKAWAGVGYALYYERQIRRVNDEIAKRKKA